MSTNERKLQDLQTSKILDEFVEMYRNDKTPEDTYFSTYFEEIMKREPFCFLDEKMTELENRCDEAEKEVKAMKEALKNHRHAEGRVWFSKI